MISIDDQIRILQAHKNRKDIKVSKKGKPWSGEIKLKTSSAFNFNEYDYNLVDYAPYALYLNLGKSIIYDDDNQHLVSTDENHGTEQYVRVHADNTKYFVTGKDDNYIHKITESFEKAEKFRSKQEDPLSSVIDKWIKI